MPSSRHIRSDSESVALQNVHLTPRAALAFATHYKDLTVEHCREGTTPWSSEVINTGPFLSGEVKNINF